VQKRAKFGVGVGIILATVSSLAVVGYREQPTYYHTIRELPNLKPSDARQRMRVAGNVEQGSIVRLPGRVDFVLLGEGQKLSVSYVGKDPLPDTFVDGSQALVEGRWMRDGRFVAEKVQAKCASKYEAAPGQQKTGNGYSAYPDRKS
jgi:cytochrome c-type biogenesis protein CcmE